MGQLPCFDGRSPDPKVWQSQAKRALRCFLSNTTDEQKLDYLLMHLTDAAYVWAESKDFKTVAGFELSFSERFVWESTATVMQKLAVLKQKKGQSVTELADEVRQLASYVKEYPTAMMVRAYIEGLEDQGLREKVLGARPVSLETAEEAAKYFVSYAQPKEIAKEEKKVKEETEVEKITKQLERLTMQLTQMQQGRGPGILPRPGGGAGGGFKCYQCEKEGHMARECPNKGRVTMNVMQQLVEKSRPAMTIAEFLNGEEGGVDMLVGERKRRAVRDPEGWGIDEAREELRKKLVSWRPPTPIGPVVMGTESVSLVLTCAAGDNPTADQSDHNIDDQDLSPDGGPVVDDSGDVGVPLVRSPGVTNPRDDPTSPRVHWTATEMLQLVQARVDLDPDWDLMRGVQGANYWAALHTLVLERHPRFRFSRAAIKIKMLRIEAQYRQLRDRLSRSGAGAIRYFPSCGADSSNRDYSAHRSAIGAITFRSHRVPHDLRG
ncbi:unnamed protein product [Closterium sp. Naga37s-1]|nr:unnamed protein product [Closterium sp. Naga37s-1]